MLRPIYARIRSEVLVLTSVARRPGWHYDPEVAKDAAAKWMLMSVLCGWACFAEESARPACNARNNGQFWPEQANTNHAAARRAERCGELQICAPSQWRYRWQPLTVHISQLGKGSKREAPGCGQPAAVAKDRTAPRPSTN